jgi:putative oxidoreductase
MPSASTTESSSLESALPRHPAILIVARYMFGLIFVMSGITHFTDMPGYVSLMHEAIPFREFWVVISGVVELAGAGMILSNRYARLGGWLIFIFLVPVTITVHGVMMVNATTPEMQGIQMSFFLKGIAMAGGALMISQFGVREPDPS